MTLYIACNCHLAQIHFTSLIYDAEKVTTPIDSTYCSSHRAQYFFVFRLKIYCIQSMLITNTCVFPLSLEWENVYTVCISTKKLLAPPIQNSNNKNIFSFTVIYLRLSNWPSRKLVDVSASYKLPGEGWILFLPLNIYFCMIKEGTRTSMRQCYSSVKRPIYRATSFKGSLQ